MKGYDLVLPMRSLKLVLRSIYPLLCAAALLLCGCAADEREPIYNAGVAAYEANDFETAYAYFVAADGYANSQEYLDAIEEYEQLYLTAVEEFNERRYEDSRNTFSAVSEFGNSQEFIDFIDDLKSLYEEGLHLYNEGDYIAARERFVQSCGYGSADAYIASIDKMEEFYQSAFDMFNQGRYAEAIELFEAIGVNYRGSYDMTSYLYGLLETQSILLSDYMEAYIESNAEAGIAMQYLLTDINEAGFMLSDSNDVMFMGNTDERGFITQISFWISTSLAEEAGDDGVHAILAHCIRALNIDMLSHGDTVSGMEEYMAGSATYGNFRFELTYDDAGFVILTAVYLYG